MIRETEVDGVPTLLAPRNGPLAAGLTFRVGQADETLATAGITHLLEHLTSNAPPKDREEEAAKAKARSAARFATA